MSIADTGIFATLLGCALLGACMQAERDPGIPSHNWQTFERACDAKQQALFEQRTGIGVRLDRLGALLVTRGRMIVFEKTRQLARRVPFQRALATRGLQLAEAPELIRYQLVEEVADVLHIGGILDYLVGHVAT